MGTQEVAEPAAADAERWIGALVVLKELLQVPPSMHARTRARAHTRSCQVSSTAAVAESRSEVLRVVRAAVRHLDPLVRYEAIGCLARLCIRDEVCIIIITIMVMVMVMVIVLAAVILLSL